MFKAAADLLKKLKAPTENVNIAYEPQGAQGYEDLVLVFGEVDQRRKVIDGFIEKIRADKDPAIILDRDAEYLKRHFNKKTDFIFNPRDARCIPWNPLNELSSMGVKALADAITTRADKEEVALANLLLKELINKLREEGYLNLANLLYMATDRCSVQEQLAYLSDTEFMAVYDEMSDLRGQAAAEQVYRDARAYLGRRFAYLEYCKTGAEIPFALNELMQIRHNGSIFVTYHPSRIELVANAINMFLACTLSLIRQEGRLETNDQRIWLVLDGVSELSFIENLLQVVRGIHQFNVGIIIGVPRVMALQTYGEEGLKTLLKYADITVVDRSCDDAELLTHVQRLPFQALGGLAHNEAAYICEGYKSVIELVELPKFPKKEDGYLSRDLEKTPSIRVKPNLRFQERLELSLRSYDILCQERELAKKWEDPDDFSEIVLPVEAPLQLVVDDIEDQPAVNKAEKQSPLRSFLPEMLPKG